MDDEEYSYAALQEPLYRVETGNYEYRSVFYSYWKVIVKINHRSWLCKFDITHCFWMEIYMYSLCQVIVSIFFGQFLLKNTHTFERNTIETNVREKIQDFFFYTLFFFYSGKIHINENRFLMEIYDGEMLRSFHHSKSLGIFLAMYWNLIS